MKKRYTIAFIIFVCALCALFLWNVGVGSVNMSLGDFFAMFGKDGSDSTLYQIIWKIRLPRITAAILLGGALSVSGFLLQSFFQNPIAGPYVLGISSGAKLVVAMTMIICLQRGVALNSAGMVIAAFAGSLIAMGFVLLISFRVSKMSLLVVCGIMIGYICSAITDFCVTFADDSNIVNLHNWSLGKCADDSCDSCGWCSHYLFACETHWGLPDGGNVCKKYGREREASAYRAHPALQYAFCLRHCFCGTDLFCGYRSAASGKTDDQNSKADYSDPGMFSVWRCNHIVL